MCINGLFNYRSSKTPAYTLPPFSIVRGERIAVSQFKLILHRSLIRRRGKNPS